jgi:hypothetical protein
MIIGVELIGSGTTRQAMPMIDLNHAARYSHRVGRALGADPSNR